MHALLNIPESLPYTREDRYALQSRLKTVPDLRKPRYTLNGQQSADLRVVRGQTPTWIRKD